MARIEEVMSTYWRKHVSGGCGHLYPLPMSRVLSQSCVWRSQLPAPAAVLSSSRKVLCLCLFLSLCVSVSQCVCVSLSLSLEPLKKTISSAAFGHGIFITEAEKKLISYLWIPHITCSVFPKSGRMPLIPALWVQTRGILHAFEAGLVYKESSKQLKLPEGALSQKNN